MNRRLTATDTGAHLTSEKVAPAALATRESLIGRLGIPVVEVDPGSWRMPLFPAPTLAQWLPDENSGVEVEQPTIGAARISPRTMASLATYSRDWQRDSIQGPQSVEGWLLQLASRTLDAAMLTGSGTEGEPLGLLNVPGVQSATVDAAATYADLCGIEEQLEAADGYNTGWILSPSGKNLLRNRHKNAGYLPILEGAAGLPVMEHSHIDGVKALSSTACPDGSLFAGDWSSATVYVFGAGPRIAVKSHGQSLFSAGLIQMRILIDLDLSFSRPERFAVATLS
jgi:HK97 family phage major capsid protein